MKKIFLFFIIFLSFSTPYAAVFPTVKDPVKKEIKTPPFKKFKVAELENFLHRKLKFKEKVALFLYNHKIVKAPFNEEENAKGTKLGKKSLTFGLLGWLMVLLGMVIPFIGLFSLIAFVFSTVYGIKSLNYKKGDTNAIIGLVLSGLYLLLFIIAIVLVIAFLRIN